MDIRQESLKKHYEWKIKTTVFAFEDCRFLTKESRYNQIEVWLCRAFIFCQFM